MWTQKNRGLESPRLFIFPSSRRIFSHYSLLITHSSKLTTQRRLEDGKPVRANSRGFLNPWNNDKIKKWRLQRRGRAVRVAGVPTAFFGVRKCNPESRRHFLASGNAIRSPDGTFWCQEMQSGVTTALFGVRKCNPGSRRPFPAYPKDKKTSMGKGFSKNKIHSLCVPRYTPLLLSTDLAAGETIGLTNAVHICEQTGGRTHVTQGCFFFMEKVLRVNQFFSAEDEK